MRKLLILSVLFLVCGAIVTGCSKKKADDFSGIGNNEIVIDNLIYDIVSLDTQNYGEILQPNTTCFYMDIFYRGGGGGSIPFLLFDNANVTAPTPGKYTYSSAKTPGTFQFEGTGGGYVDISKNEDVYTIVFDFWRNEGGKKLAAKGRFVGKIN